MNSTYKIIYDAVSQIPKGKVATYGQIAAMAGNRHLSRTVGNALHCNPDPLSIPCHRVVNAKGMLAEKYAFGGIEAQRDRLISEGVAVRDYKVDLDKYRW